MSALRSGGLWRTSWRDLAGEEGTAIIEFAFLMPAFLLILYGLIEFGHYGYMRVALADAAREGVRYAMVRGAASAAPATSTSITAYVRSRIALLDGSDVTVTSTFTPDNQPGSLVKVQVSYPYEPFLLGYNFLTAATVTDSAQMTIAQ